MSTDDENMHPDPAYVGNTPTCDFAWITGDKTHACVKKQQGHAGKHRCACGAET